ncbi:MAG: RNA methyltransferase [Candidatus Promineifilaceae bacterium]|nr:RNA methyltransferase [Candidatus Promineifilaceae bacterium]
MANAPRFLMRQCVQPSCRFRFPVPAASRKGEECPRCGAATYAATEPFSGHRPEPSGSGAGPAVEALLDNVRSILNVGSIFRTADGAGIRPLHLCGITATPDHPKLAKTALGAETAVPWRYNSNGVDAAEALKAGGRQLWALESSGQSDALFDIQPDPAGAPIVLVVGHERAGVDPGILTLCDRVLHIPMQGVKASLNVATAFGIAAYYLRFG